jgi:BlaI family penicillinase repressor
MARPRSQHPTELELQIIKIIWRDGPSNVRHVRDELSAWRELAYTSVMTIMNIMADKGYLRRVKQGPSFTYHPRVTERTTTRKMLMDVVDRAFDGSAAAAIEAVLDGADIGAEERELLRGLMQRKLEVSACPA